MRSMSVHPRVRGERIQYANVDQRERGSSPRSRGTVINRLAGFCCLRFIPAFAGNGLFAFLGSGPCTVHPRVRGERAINIIFDGPPSGSSPRSRGTVGLATATGRADRFIPAFAGNGNAGTWIFVRHSVHPRVRGERITCVPSAPRLAGSSPRSRGTVASGKRYCSRLRFIPAFAGNGLHEAPICLALAVHPRVRGERPS